MSFGKFYHSLTELPMADRPPDDLVQDDELIDRWYENYVRDLQRRSKSKAGTPVANFSDIPQFSG